MQRVIEEPLCKPLKEWVLCKILIAASSHVIHLAAGISEFISSMRTNTQQMPVMSCCLSKSFKILMQLIEACMVILIDPSNIYIIHLMLRICHADVFECVPCLKAKSASALKQQSGTTLIVCPSPILNQWLTELDKHIKPGKKHLESCHAKSEWELNKVSPNLTANSQQAGLSDLLLAHPWRCAIIAFLLCSISRSVFILHILP